MDSEEWNFLLTGGLGDGGQKPNPAPEWLTDRAWREILRLGKLAAFMGVAEHVIEVRKLPGCTSAFLKVFNETGCFRI